MLNSTQNSMALSLVEFLKFCFTRLGVARIQEQILYAKVVSTKMTLRVSQNDFTYPCLTIFQFKFSQLPLFFSCIMLVIPCSNLPVAMTWKVFTVISLPIREGVFLSLNIAYHFSTSLLHNRLRCLQEVHLLPMTILDS